MNPSTANSNTQTLENFALEGVLPLWLLILLGAGLIAFAVWLALRDLRFANRSKLVPVLLLLRCSAILILLWMLAGPTKVLTTRKFNTKSIAIFVDTSASMGLVDPIDGSGNLTRWTATHLDSPSTRLLQQLDQAISTLGVARNQLLRFSELPATPKQTPRNKALLERSLQGLQTGTLLTRELIDQLPASESQLKSELTKTIDSLEQSLFPQIQTKAAELSRGKALDALERDQWLPDSLNLLSASLARLERLADLYSQQAEAQPDSSLAQALATDSSSSRLEKVEAWLRDAESTWLKTIAEKATVSRYVFGEKVIPATPETWRKAADPDRQTDALQPNTNLDTPLQQVVVDNIRHSVEAAILITDGGHNLGRDPRASASSIGRTPLHIVPIGNTKMQRDVILHHTHAPRAAFLNDLVVVDATVTAYDCADESLQIELLAQDQVVDRQIIKVSSQVFDGRLQLKWKAETLGRHDFNVRARPLNDERTLSNNDSKVSVQIMEDKIRVLLADNSPRWEFRYLANLFNRDDRVEFEQLLFKPAHTHSGRPLSLPVFPYSPEDWSRYRVVILGDVTPTQLTPEHQSLLKQYVTELGGNLIIIAGTESMPAAFASQPLAEMLPVERARSPIDPAQPYYLHVTAEGGASLATQLAEDPIASERLWREMSHRLPLYDLSPFSHLKPTAHSLISASRRKEPDASANPTFLSWQFVGRGRVVYLTAPVTYQLRYRKGDLYHHRFWGQLLRWIVARDLAEGSRTVRLSTDKTIYEKGDSVQATLRLYQLDGRTVSGANCLLTAFQADRVIKEISLTEEVNQPGTYHGILEALPAGSVKLSVSGDRIKSLLLSERHTSPIEVNINIDPSGALELRHPLCNLPLLRQLAQASGGMIVPPAALPAALQQLDLEPEISESAVRRPLWNRWDLFWAFILCLTLEWIGRKFLGLA